MWCYLLREIMFLNTVFRLKCCKNWRRIFFMFIYVSHDGVFSPARKTSPICWNWIWFRFRNTLGHAFSFFQKSSRINHFAGTIGLTEPTNICKGAGLIKMDHLMGPAGFLIELGEFPNDLKGYFVEHMVDFWNMQAMKANRLLNKIVYGVSPCLGLQEIKWAKRNLEWCWWKTKNKYVAGHEEELRWEPTL